MAPADHADAVRRAWCETLGVDSCAGPWDAAGGDSIATLHFVFLLEQLLGRSLLFELLRPDMTAAEMAAALDAPEPIVEPSALPMVFLMAGLLGDGPSLAAFRRRLAGKVRFTLVPLCNLSEPAAMVGDVPATARHAVAQIIALQPEGPLLLAGYSFGGSIALEAAAQLAEAGRRVAHVTVLDSAFGDAVLGRPSLPWRRRWRRHAAWAVMPLLEWDGGRSRALALADRLAPRQAPRLRRFALRRLRTEARLGWQPRSLDVPMLLALSDEFAPVMGPAWARFYPHAAITHVPTTHFNLLKDDALEQVADAFEASLKQ